MCFITSFALSLSWTTKKSEVCGKVIQAIQDGRQGDIALGDPPFADRDTPEFCPFKTDRYHVCIENALLEGLTFFPSSSWLRME